jgi:acetylornithine deacetylase
VFESVIEEECTGNGMLAQRLATGPVDGAIILEPTGLTTWTATPGVVWFTVRVTGKPAYVGRAADYVNAVESAAALIGRLKAAAVPALNAAFTHPAFRHLDNPLTLSVGKIEGGVWPSSVPLECAFTCRMSYPIDWGFADVRAFVTEQVRAAAEADAWLAGHPPAVTFAGFRASGWEGQPESALNRTLAAAHKAELGAELQQTVFPGTADARYFGRDEIVAYYGPSGGGIHGPDEYVELESVRRTARTLARFIAEWCG